MLPVLLLLRRRLCRVCCQAKTCLQYNAAGDLTKRVCCKGTCALVVNTTTPPTKRRMCCPWTPQAIPGSTPTNFACCPDGTKAQPDGTCCNPFLLCSGPAGTVCCALGTTCNAATGTCAAIPCAAPNTTCAFFPSLLPGDCCPRGACRPVWNPLPAPYGKAANTKACCPEVCVAGLDAAASLIANDVRTSGRQERRQHGSQLIWGNCTSASEL